MLNRRQKQIRAYAPYYAAYYDIVVNGLLNYGIQPNEPAAHNSFSFVAFTAALCRAARQGSKDASV